MFEQPGVALDTIAITGKRTIGSDHTMTRHDGSNRICTIGQTNSPNSCRPTNLFGKLRIRNGRAAGNLSQRTPHITLKRRAACLQWQTGYRR